MTLSSTLPLLQYKDFCLMKDGQRFWDSLATTMTHFLSAYSDLKADPKLCLQKVKSTTSSGSLLLFWMWEIGYLPYLKCLHLTFEFNMSVATENLFYEIWELGVRSYRTILGILFTLQILCGWQMMWCGQHPDTPCRGLQVRLTEGQGSIQDIHWQHQVPQETIHMGDPLWLKLHYPY